MACHAWLILTGAPCLRLLEDGCIFLQLNRDCSAVRWSWQRYILVDEIVRVTECSHPAMRHMWPADESLWTVEMHSAVTARTEGSENSSPSASPFSLQRLFRRSSSRASSLLPSSLRQGSSCESMAAPDIETAAIDATRRSLRGCASQHTEAPAEGGRLPARRFKAVECLHRSFCIEYAGGGRSGCKTMVLTCPGRRGCANGWQRYARCSRHCTRYVRPNCCPGSSSSSNRPSSSRTTAAATSQSVSAAPFTSGSRA